MIRTTRSALFSASLLGLLCALSLPSQAEDARTIRFATEGAYPPFNSINAAGELVGFEVDLAKALCVKLKTECTYVAQEWDGIITGLNASKYDVIIASMLIMDERKDKVSFTDPYYRTGITFVGNKDTTISVFNNETMKGKTIGAQASTSQANFLTDEFPDAEIKLYPTQDEANMDMAGGRLDFIVSDPIPMMEWIENSEDGKCCKLVGDLITDRKVVGDGIGMAVRKDDDQLRQDLNKALAEVLADGTYKSINDKYFKINIYDMK